MATRTEKWLQQIANRQGTKKVCADNGLPFCLPHPPTGTDVDPLLLLPLLPCPLPRPVFLPLIPLAPAPVAVPGPAPHHQLHHHTCLCCCLQLPVALPVLAPHHHQHHHIAAASSFLKNYLLPTEPLSPPYLSQISIVFPSLYFNSNHIIMASYIKLTFLNLALVSKSFKQLGRAGQLELMTEPMRYEGGLSYGFPILFIYSCPAFRYSTETCI